MDGHAAIGSQTGTIIGIFWASGNAGREGERLLAPLRDGGTIAATRLIVCDGHVKKEGPSNRPSPLPGSTDSASINNPCHPCRHQAWQASVSPSWVSRRPSPL